MHIGQGVHDSIVFVGWEDSASSSGFKSAGTAFLVHHQGDGYLVTAAHVAQILGDDPFVIRVNRKGKAEFLHADMTAWTRHPDETVDVAVTPLRLTLKTGFDAKYLSSDILLTDDSLSKSGVNVGDFCYTVGLFHFVHGQSLNLPMVYSGGIALMPPAGERIPVGGAGGKTEWVEGYLIESRAISGASGSPVFVRNSVSITDIPEEIAGVKSVMVTESSLHLLGIFQSAWFLEPDSAARQLARVRTGEVVPVGLGVVVPSQKIMDILEMDSLKKEREARQPI
jgi:hypothetical protein